MSVLVIGGDRINTISKKLEEKGFDYINHISGRKKNDIKFTISDDLDLVLVLTDYIGHTLSKNIKKKSKDKDVKVLFSNRCWAQIENGINEYFNKQH